MNSPCFLYLENIIILVKNDSLKNAAHRQFYVVLNINFKQAGL